VAEVNTPKLSLHEEAMRIARIRTVLVCADLDAAGFDLSPSEPAMKAVLDHLYSAIEDFVRGDVVSRIGAAKANNPSGAVATDTPKEKK